VPGQSAETLATGIYPGWMVLAAGFLCAMMAVGCTTYIFGVFVLPVTTEFGISRSEANNGMILLMVGAAAWSPLVGRLLDRAPVRLVMATGALLFGGSLAAISQAQSLPMMAVVIAAPLSLGFAGAGALAANTVVVRWFMARRGRALGVLAVSTSAGGFVFAPLTAVLIEQFGWRNALLAVGLGTGLTMLLLALFVIRDRPRGDEPGHMGEFATAGSGTRTVAGEQLWSYGQLLANRNFWLLTGGLGLLFASDQALLASQVPYFQDAGISLSGAAMIAACMTVSAMLGKLVVGALADRVDLRLLFLGIALCHIGLLGVFIVQPGFWVLVVTASVMGIAVGGVYPLWMTLMAWAFGARSYGTVMGTMAVMKMPLSILALRFAGESFDRTGSYDLAFSAFIVGVVLATGLIFALREPEPHTAEIPLRTAGARE